ncbi:unnamed protein product, partial [Colletotrichum noveboracense]
MRGFIVFASALCASYVSAQQGAVCFDDLDCLLAGGQNAKCTRAQAGAITGNCAGGTAAGGAGAGAAAAKGKGNNAAAADPIGSLLGGLTGAKAKGKTATAAAPAKAK